MPCFFYQLKVKDCIPIVPLKMKNTVCVPISSFSKGNEKSVQIGRTWFQGTAQLSPVFGSVH